jgi:hypothetical protein
MLTVVRIEDESFTVCDLNSEPGSKKEEDSRPNFHMVMAEGLHGVCCCTTVDAEIALLQSHMIGMTFQGLCQRPSVQLVRAPEWQLEVLGSIPRWNEFWGLLKKFSRCVSSALEYLCMFATLQYEPLQSVQLAWPVSNERSWFMGFLDQDQLVP